MRSSKKRMGLACAALAAIGLLAGGVKPAEAVPQMAVYTGPAPQGPTQNTQWANWIGKSNVWGADFTAWDNWGEIENPKWLYDPWGQWERNNPSQNMLLGVPMLPSDGSGNWVDGANGAYDFHFQNLFNNLKNAGVTRAVLRIGWEMNGGWYPWSPGNNATNIANFKTYFNRIASIAHNTSGATFKVCWNPNNGWNQQPTDQLWPGKAQVDYIGVDIYDAYPAGGNGTQGEYANSYTTQPNATQQAQAWADYKNSYGLDYYVSLSQQEGVPLTVPEWGLWQLNQGRPAGGDNPLFIQNMYDWMNANNVAIQCYFDTYAKDGNHQLWPGPNGTDVSVFPNGKAKFKQLFGAAALGLTNKGFENGNLSGWNRWVGSNSAAGYASNSSGEYVAGSWGYMNWSSSSYEMTLYQTANKPNGSRVVSAWVRSGGGQTTCRMEVSDYGGSPVYVNFPVTTAWKQISTTVNVTSGKVTVGFYSKAGANQWSNVDEVAIS